jgi:hypothetical protein
MKSRHLVRLGVPIAILATASTALSFMQIMPAPLWRLARDCEWIVIATVNSVDGNPTRSNGLDGRPVRMGQVATAHLTVLERWKGEAPATLDVQIEPTMSGDEPSYEPGRTVLAFLWHYPDGVLRTTGYRYGTLYPSAEAIPIFAARVREALVLQANEKTTRAARLEWLVACAENRATRWHGVQDLNSPGRPMPSRDDQIRIQPSELLSDAQRARIARGFVRDPEVDSGIVEMLEVLGTYRDKEFDRALLAAIHRELDSKQPRFLDLSWIMPAVFVRAGLVDADSRPSVLDLEGNDASKLATLRVALKRAERALLNGPDAD